MLDGDYVYLEVIPTDNEALLLNDVITTPVQYVAITNFHSSGKKLEFEDFTLNGIRSNFYTQSGAYYYSGEYLNQSINLNFTAINPRDDELLIPGEEPFYSGTRYILSCSTGVLATGFQDSLDFNFINEYEQRDLDFQFILEDVYNSGTTGFINLKKPTIVQPSVLIARTQIVSVPLLM